MRIGPRYTVCDHAEDSVCIREIMCVFWRNALGIGHGRDAVAGHSARAQVMGQLAEAVVDVGAERNGDEEGKQNADHGVEHWESDAGGSIIQGSR